MQASLSQQLTLPIERAYEQTLVNFVPGQNEEVVSALELGTGSFTGIWVCGAKSTGKTHLLRGATLASEDLAATAIVDCSLARTSRDHLLSALYRIGRYARVVALDNVVDLAADEACEEALLTVYERVRAVDGLFVVADRLAAAATEFRMNDLNSRLRGLMHYRLVALTDEDKAELLIARARHRGYTLSDSVLAYWLSRGSRDLSVLLTDLDRLDRASLVHRRHVTIPLLKDVLGY